MTGLCQLGRILTSNILLMLAYISATAGLLLPSAFDKVPYMVHVCEVNKLG